jgi:hypothetical protein
MFCDPPCKPDTVFIRLATGHASLLGSASLGALFNALWFMGDTDEQRPLVTT